MNKKKEEYKEDVFFQETGDENDLDFMDLVFTLVRRWKLIVASTVAVTLLGTGLALTKAEVYMARTKLMISNGNYSARNLDSNELFLNQQLVTTYAEIAKNREVSLAIIQKFGLNMTPEAMTKKIGIEPVQSTEFINITYRDQEPRLAAMVSNEIARAFMVRVKDLMGVQNLKIVERAEVPVHPSGIGKKLIVAISMVLGAMIGIFIALALELVYNNIRKPQDIEKIMGCPVIGSIPDFEDLQVREVKKNVEK